MINIFIMCSGLGHIGRGYESFSRELFDELKAEEDFQLTLLKGAGTSSKNEQAVFCIKRTSQLARVLGRIVKQPVYHIEQISFLLFAIPTILVKKPKVIVYSDFYLGVLLWYLRKYLHLNYKLLFSNGAPNGPPFLRCDFVQQLLPFYKEQALQAGENSGRHFVLPYAIDVPLAPVRSEEKEIAKEKLGLGQYTVILTVAAINDSHKRISYLIDEVKSLADTSIYLVVLGQQNEESVAIINKGNELLPARFLAKTVWKEELEEYYKAADVFVLPSLTEGLPRVMLEALSFGLPVASHDYPVSRNVLEEWGSYADFREKGNLKQALEAILVDKQILSQEKSEKRHAYVLHKFSWKALKQQYKDMILNVAQDK